MHKFTRITVSPEEVARLQQRRRPAARYGFAEMAVGDGIESSPEGKAALKSAARAYQSRTDVRFAFVALDNGAVRAIRVA